MFLEKKKVTLVLKKTHNKVRFVGKKYFLISAFFYKYLYNNLISLPKKSHRFLYKRLYRRNYLRNSRSFLLHYISQIFFFKKKIFLIDLINVIYLIFEKCVFNSINLVFFYKGFNNNIVIDIVINYFCCENLVEINKVNVFKKAVINIDRIKKILFRFVYLMMISLDYYFLTDFQLELIRRIARKTFGKRAFLKLFIIANKNILKRSNNVRMGGGKGAKLKKKVYCLIPGSRILELRGVNVRLLKIFKKKLLNKMSFNFRIVKLNRF